MNRKRTKYSAEFKREAVELAEKIGFAQAGRDLGINDNNIRKWSTAGIQQNVSPESPKSAKDLEAEVRKLKKENEYLKAINEVLKKSTAIFSNENMRGLK